MNNDLEGFRSHIESVYAKGGVATNGGSFGEILCYELHTQPVNPRMRAQTISGGFETGLTFKELAKKWGISVTLLGELIADHCRRLEG